MATLRTQLHDGLEEEGEGVVHEHVQQEAQGGRQQPGRLHALGELDGCTPRGKRSRGQLATASRDSEVMVLAGTGAFMTLTVSWPLHGAFISVLPCWLSLSPAPPP